MSQALPERFDYNLVLGQAKKSVRRINGPEDRSLSGPVAVALDRSHSPTALYVAELLTGRVLGYRDVSRFETGAPADLVVGQDDAVDMHRYRISNRRFAWIGGIAVDKEGTLWVSDTGNGRVMGFAWPFDPSKNREENVTADYLVGTASFDAPVDKRFYEVGCNGGTLIGWTNLPVQNAKATTLCGPEGITTDSQGRLYVADTQNSRVMLFATPKQMGTAASLIFGHTRADTPPQTACNRAYDAYKTPDAATLCKPTDLFVQDGATPRLIVADTGNSRVLIYNTPQNDQVADVVLGQPLMTTNSPGVGPERLRSPQGVSLDAAGVLWVSDSGNHRLLGFEGTFIDGMGASKVIGQLDTNGSVSNQGVAGRPSMPPTAATLSTPRGVIFDDSGNMILPDQNNNRVLLYRKPDHQAVADKALGQVDLSHGAEGRTKASSLSFPVGMTVDRRAGEVPHVYVADYGNSRVLGWWDLGSLLDGKVADVVIGQRSMSDNTCNRNGGVNAQTLCWPRAVFVDKNGDLWVADTWNHRVLRFPEPFKQSKQEANLVLGQTSFLGALQNGNGSTTVTARGLTTPTAVVVEPSGVVWVADRDNDRVVGYLPPYSNGMNAGRLLIGAGITSYAQTGCPQRGKGAYLCGPAGLALDERDHLWVADRDNNRVALFNTQMPAANGVINPLPEAILGQTDPAAGSINIGQGTVVSAKGLRGPEGVSVEVQTGMDGKSQAVAIVVADTDNNRILVFDPVQAKYGPDAKAVIGQSDFTKAAKNTDDTAQEAPDNIAKGVWLPGAVLALPQALLIADSGATLRGTFRQGSVQPSLRDDGNHRVIVIKGSTFPSATPDSAVPVDMAVPEGSDLAGSTADLSAGDGADLATGGDNGGGGCNMSPMGTLPPLVAGLALVLSSLLLRRRRRP